MQAIPSVTSPRPAAPLPALPSLADLGPVVMADDPCMAASSAPAPDLENQYYRARYYDPKAGRFINEDPARDGLNFYGYVSNNPALFSDPFGLERWDQWDRDPKSWAQLTQAQQVVGVLLIASGPYSRSGVASNSATTQWFGEAISGAEAEYGSAMMFAGVTNACRRWRVGDDVLALTRAGNVPSWSAQRARFWKNAATFAEAVQKWGADNLARMRRGLAPQRYNHAKPGIESMELSHEPIPQCQGGTACVPRWPQDHAAVDPFRRPGY